MDTLKLSNASANWVRASNEDKWAVTAQSGEVLSLLPESWSAKDCMIAIRLGREYELKAFNIGIEFGKEEAARRQSSIINKLNKDGKELSAMNERLSLQLEKFIIGAD